MLILGSQSPRRKEILDFFSIPFIQAIPDFDEEAIAFQGDPERYACTLSQGKAESLQKKFPDAIILTADTIVYQDGKVYNKPKNAEDAFNMLSELAGKWHSVYTAVTVRQQSKIYSKAEETKVQFNPLTPKQIGQYIESVECLDKAGSYAIQNKGGIIVRQISGCYFNVKGLPINTVVELLHHFGVEIWEHL